MPIGSIIAPVAGWLLLGGIALGFGGPYLLLVTAGLIACVMAAVHHAEVVAARVGEPFGTLVLPYCAEHASGPFYSPLQLCFIAVVSVVLYGTFVLVQTVRHRGYFLPAGGDVAAAEPPAARAAWASGILLLACLGAVVLL